MEENSRAANKKAKGRHRGTLSIVLGLIMIIGALGLTAYNIWDSKRAKNAADEVSVKLIEEIGVDGSESNMQVPMFDPNKPMPSKTIDGNEYLGILEIPSEDIILPVTWDWDYDRLDDALCRFYGSYYSDDLVICGHNFSEFLSPLWWIDIGADVYLTTVEGMMIHYIVTNRETLSPSEVAPFVENIHNSETSTADWELTVFTCNPDVRTRCVVRCKRVEASEEYQIMQ